MPIYTYSCKECGAEPEEIRPVAECEEDLECPECGGVAKRTIGNAHTTEQAFDRPVLSRSLAIPCPKQRAQMQKLHPDRKYLPDGRLVIKSHAQRNKILKEEGYVDHDGYN